MARRLLLLLVTLLASVLLFASPASAHNSLLSSDPADGAVLAAAPTQLTLTFDKSVPLDTLSIELIDASGVRSDLSNFTHGPNGNQEVVVAFPALGAGSVSLRWNLVGADGHVVTGRVSFTITAPTTVPATVPPTVPTATTAALPATTVPSATVPTATTVPSATVPPATVPTATDSGAGFEDRYETSSSVRWFLRFSSYVAIMTLGGVLATTAFVWQGAWDHPTIQRAVRWALGITAATALAQLLVVASDISGSAPWASLGEMSSAFSTDAGVAYGLRLILVGALAWAMFFASTQSDESQWTLAVVMLLGLLATWAYAGHSRSQRWSLIGIPVDIAHHAAAAAWIGGLAIVGLVVVREGSTDDLIDSVNRFARVASVGVTVIVITGVVQTFRLVGSPLKLFEGGHGRLLVVKMLILAAMLKVADVNRRRVMHRLRSRETASRRVVFNLRRAMGTELAVGLAIIAVTAALVVSPPASAQDTNRSPSTTTLPLTPGESTTSAAPPTSAGAVACVLTGAQLQLGSSGADVVCLQQALQAAGLYSGAATGTFDSATDSAVRALQTQRGLLVDGIVGRVTATALGIWPTG